MSLVIGTNMASLNAQRNLAGAQAKSAIAMERLSTGIRVNSGQDDAAGLAIGSKMGATIRGLNQAVRNANDGISMAKAGDGAMGEISNMLQRMRELATEKNDGSMSTTDLANVSTEMSAIGTEIDHILSNTKFNDISLLDGTLSATFQVGELSTDTFALVNTSITGGLTKGSTIDEINTAFDDLGKARAAFGAAMTALQARSANTSVLAENLTSARGQIMDADIAQETANMTKASVLQQAGIAVLAQANQAPNMVLSLLR